MEENERGKSWLLLLILVPVGMAAGVMITKWVLHPGKTALPAPVEQQAEAVTPSAQANPEPAAADSAAYDLPGDEQSGGQAGIIWADKTASAPAAGAKPAAAAPAAAPAVDAKDAKEYHGMGLVRGAISKAVEKLLNNPKAVNALLSNDYVVKGFMSRDTVKNVTRDSNSLSNYLKNPANLNNFMGKSVVQNGMNNDKLVNAVASSKLVGALMDTPGGKALLKDPAALAGILKANPGLADVLTNPAILSALMQNPQTAGIATNLNMGGLLR
jgi:hypothetical protein